MKMKSKIETKHIVKSEIDWRTLNFRNRIFLNDCKIGQFVCFYVHAPGDYGAAFGRYAYIESIEDDNFTGGMVYTLKTWVGDESYFGKIIVRNDDFYYLERLSINEDVPKSILNDIENK